MRPYSETTGILPPGPIGATALSRRPRRPFPPRSRPRAAALSARARPPRPRDAASSRSAPAASPAGRRPPVNACRSSARPTSSTPAPPPGGPTGNVGSGHKPWSGPPSKKPRRGRVEPRPTAAGRAPPRRRVPGPRAVPGVRLPAGRTRPHPHRGRRRGAVPHGGRAAGRGGADLRLAAGDGEAPPGRGIGQRPAGPARAARTGVGRGTAAPTGADPRPQPPVPRRPEARGRPDRDPPASGVGGRPHRRRGAVGVRVPGRPPGRMHPRDRGRGVEPRARPGADPDGAASGGAARAARQPALGSGAPYAATASVEPLTRVGAAIRRAAVAPRRRTGRPSGGCGPARRRKWR